MSTHTKGPWTKEFAAFTPGYASTMRIFSQDGTRAVADVFWGETESHQNANLIAAAPEMLKALEFVIMKFDFGENVNDYAYEETFQVVQAAKNAINKARGIT